MYRRSSKCLPACTTCTVLHCTALHCTALHCPRDTMPRRLIIMVRCPCLSQNRYRHALRMFGTGCAVKSAEALRIGLADDTYKHAHHSTGLGSRPLSDSQSGTNMNDGIDESAAAAARAGATFLAPFVSAGEPHVIREIKRMTKSVSGVCNQRVAFNVVTLLCSTTLCVRSSPVSMLIDPPRPPLSLPLLPPSLRLSLFSLSSLAPPPPPPSLFFSSLSLPLALASSVSLVSPVYILCVGEYQQRDCGRSG